MIIPPGISQPKGPESNLGTSQVDQGSGPVNLGTSQVDQIRISTALQDGKPSSGTSCVELGEERFLAKLQDIVSQAISQQQDTLLERIEELLSFTSLPTSAPVTSASIDMSKATSIDSVRTAGSTGMQSVPLNLPSMSRHKVTICEAPNNAASTSQSVRSKSCAGGFAVRQSNGGTLAAQIGKQHDRVSASSSARDQRSGAVGEVGEHSVGEDEDADAQWKSPKKQDSPDSEAGYSSKAGAPPTSSSLTSFPDKAGVDLKRRLTVMHVTTALEDTLLDSFMMKPPTVPKVKVLDRSGSLPSLSDLMPRNTWRGLGSTISRLGRGVSTRSTASTWSTAVRPLSVVASGRRSLTTESLDTAMGTGSSSTGSKLKYHTRSSNVLAPHFDVSSTHRATEIRAEVDEVNAYGFGDARSYKHLGVEGSFWTLVLPRACGIVPWRATWRSEKTCCLTPDMWYQLLAVALSVASTAVSFKTVMRMQELAPDQLCLSISCLQSENMLADISLAVGTLVGSVLCVHYRDSLDESLHLLLSYASHESFGQHWFNLIHGDVAVTLVLWVLVVIVRVWVANEFLSSPNIWNTLHFIAFALNSIILASFSFLVLFFCRCMLCAIDSYVVKVVAAVKLDEGVPRWNAVQAVLRKTARSLHALLVTLQATIFLLAMVSFAYAYHHTLDGTGNLQALLPPVLLVFSTVRIFFTAAEVTEKCIRVPSLVNACMFGRDTSAERSFLVQYITSSAAGFYMFQVRVTAQMTVKFAHVCAVAMFAFMTQVLK